MSVQRLTRSRPTDERPAKRSGGIRSSRTATHLGAPGRTTHHPLRNPWPANLSPLSVGGSTVSPMRPDTPAENVDHNAEAARLERAAGLYPEDAEHLLLQSAAHRELADDRPGATALYDRLLSSSEPLENPHLVRALKASNL